MRVTKKTGGMVSAALLAGVVALSIGTAKAEQSPPPITKEEMKKAAQIYFDRCAGCHGMLRKGATGPALTPDRTRKLGTEALEAFIYNGTLGGMPDWGKQGILSKEEINLLARYLQHEPPPPPELSMQQMKSTWKVYMAPEDRPTRPQHSLNWKNFFGVILRDVGKVAIVDGDTKKLVNVVNTGFAVHILRSSASGRYMYAIGRDGKATVIDLWLSKPDKVAEVKVCYDARSIDTSKYHGFEDKYAVVGCYWPPSFVVLDGETLEPKKIVSTSSYYYDTQEFVREARVASIVSSHYDPIWVLNIKEAGQVWLVDYSKVDKGTVKIDMIDAERYLHDGGWDLSKRYFLVAANMRNKVVVIDTKDKELEAIVKVGTKPHPGRGANIDHPKYGPIWCTGHIGEKRIACIGTDPQGHPQYAWKVVKWINLPGEGGGNLFIKTHPKSKYLIADRPLNPDPQLKRSIFVFDKNTFELVKTLKVPEKYKNIRAVHEEFNEDGSEFWISVWGKKDKPTAILVYDANTLKLKKEITGDWVRTPTGKFNVYNTMKDIY
ncbi:nitrite reductase [Persephonella sp.]|uniref:nitrite reductase n=1 Tax=Persephonella sp. TaxID=2060922 RepID=UPI0025E4B1E0|nr:nitrite reductase [Persephonella sp.]